MDLPAHQQEAGKVSMAFSALQMRSGYSAAQKQLVRDNYGHCATRSEKIKLARKASIRDPRE
jgi:hypothetical protein